MPVPYTFGTATAAIPLSQLDSNFATAVTIGNTAVQLGNTVTTLNNMTLANVTISSGNVTLTNVAVTTANVSGTANVSSLVVLTNETVLGNTAVTGNVTASINVTGAKLIPTGSSVTGNGLYLPAANALGLSTNGTNAVYIDSSQNVGVGVTPSAWATVVPVIQIGTGGAFIAAQGSASTVRLGANAYYDTGWKYTTTAAASTYQQLNGAHLWNTAASGTAGNTISFTQAMTLDASSNLLVGATSFTNATGRSNYIGIGGIGASGVPGLILKGNTDYPGEWTIGLGAASGANNLVISDDGTERARIDSSGNFYVKNMAVGGTANLHWSSSNGQFFVTSSSRRFKHDIVEYDKGLAELMQMQPKYFVYNDEPNQKQRAGFIAEDFHDLGMTEYVEYWKDDEGNDTPSEIGYSNMVAILVKSIQEQQALITQLTARITALEGA